MLTSDSGRDGSTSVAAGYSRREKHPQHAPIRLYGHRGSLWVDWLGWVLILLLTLMFLIAWSMPLVLALAA